MERSLADRVVRRCTPETVETDLEALWREVADQTPATRTIMSNLIVYRSCFHSEAIDLESPVERLPIEAVVQRHPSRVIVLQHEDEPGALQRPVAAAAGILLFGSEESRMAVEQITIRSVTAEESLPSIVRRFVLGDLPTSVWWIDDLSRCPPLTALVTMGRQFIYDSLQWRDVAGGLSIVAGLLDHSRAPDVVDVNWRRLAPLRKALELGYGKLEPAKRPVRVIVRHRAEERAKAWLMIGWLASLFERGAHMPLDISAEQRDDEPSVTISIERKPGETVSATLDESQAVFTDPAAAPLVVKGSSERQADAVAAELRELGHDLALVAAIRTANRRLSAGA
jgi:glucose-6-phosphate dehydrogenase assembly protein OpcA